MKRSKIIAGLIMACMAFTFSVSSVQAAIFYKIKITPSNSLEISAGYLTRMMIQTLGVDVSSATYTNCGTSSGHVYEHYICYFVLQDYIDPNVFSANDKVTRGQAAVVFKKVFMANISNTFTEYYPDVPMGIWYADAVTTLVEQGITDVQPNGIALFQPSKNITFGEATIWLNNIEANIL